jgi:hypothetical protein
MCTSVIVPRGSVPERRNHRESVSAVIDKLGIVNLHLRSAPSVQKHFVMSNPASPFHSRTLLAENERNAINDMIRASISAASWLTASNFKLPILTDLGLMARDSKVGRVGKECNSFLCPV